MAAEPIDPARLARTAFDIAVFAPIGLGTMIVEDGPAAIERLRRELANARIVGRFAVAQGATRLRTAADEGRAAARSSERKRDVAEGASDSVEESDADPIGLAIAGYDELPAIEIVALLDDLSVSERRAVADHEQANRRRRTVLGKISQLDEA